MTRLLLLYRDSFSNLQRNAWILALAMFINRSGSMVLLFTSLYFTRELHFGIAETGFIMSFYGFGSVLGSYSGGWLTDRKNFFDIMLLSLFCSGTILMLMLFVSGKFWLCAVIFSYAFFADMFRPAHSAAISSYSTPENLTRSVSLARLAINLGFSVGPAIGGVIAMYLGYKWLFVIDATTSFAAGVMLAFYLPKHKAEKNRHENAVLKDSTTSAYRDKKYLFFIFLVALYGICFFQLFASIPQFFSRECNYNEATIGLLLALNGFLVVIIEMPLIAHLEKKKKIFRYVIAGTLCIPVSFFILQNGNALIVWALVYTIIITLSEIFAMPFMMNHALSSSPKERKGQYMALYSIGYGIANILAPSLGLGIAGKYGFNNMFYFFIGVSILTALGFGMLGRKEKKIIVR
ncbi:MAG: MFS transporter [Bacteroidetes bacterium]|nr:MFS transporter [Bacteroidota bacterium]